MCGTPSCVWLSSQVPLHEVRPRSSDPKVAIDDLLLECANEDPTQARKSVGAVLLRFTSELRQIYNAYSALPIPGFVEAHELGLVPGSPDAGAYEPEGAEEGYDEGGFEGQERTLDAGRGGAFEPRNPDPNKPNEVTATLQDCGSACRECAGASDGSGGVERGSHGTVAMSMQKEAQKRHHDWRFPAARV